jgi:hypothetical protein
MNIIYDNIAKRKRREYIPIIAGIYARSEKSDLFPKIIYLVKFIVVQSENLLISYFYKIHLRKLRQISWWHE